MQADDIRSLLLSKAFPCDCTSPQLEETHISWVIICDDEVFKIKKPILYDFLDFSTTEKRRKYCEEELRLNRRLAPEVYLDVLPVTFHNGKCAISGEGNPVDYAVHMKRLPSKLRMDILLGQHRVSQSDIDKLVSILAEFHQGLSPVMDYRIQDFLDHVNAIERLIPDVTHFFGNKEGERVRQMCSFNQKYIRLKRPLFQKRLADGFIRDCHGDLHSRNVFLTQNPVIFDCIEFNSAYRTIDLLNEIAFMCMDLDSFGRDDLSEYFLKSYNQLLDICRNDEEYQLFIFFKTYRANVRAKVNILRAVSSSENEKHLANAHKYLDLMNKYLELIKVKRSFPL